MSSIYNPRETARFIQYLAYYNWIFHYSMKYSNIFLVKCNAICISDTINFIFF